jgi:integration host factor subunit alpha
VDHGGVDRDALIFIVSRGWGQAMTKTRNAVTRVDLYEAVYQKVGLSRTESSALVELVLKEISDCLEKGETVKLSSFGSFVVRKKGGRIGRNPKTGTEVPISPRHVLVFKASTILKQRLNGRSSGKAALAPVEPRSSVAAGWDHIVHAGASMINFANFARLAAVASMLAT